MTQVSTEITDTLINEMTEIIVRESNPETIVLFGSYANGNPGPESDVDFLVIVPNSFTPGRSRRAEMIRIWKALTSFPVAKDILVYSRAEVEQWRHARNHIIARALREGRVLYGSL